MRTWLLVGIGGFAGSILRYAFSRWISEQTSGSFPWGTLAVNLAGCLLIGLFWGISERFEWFGTGFRMTFIVGLCGGFTTFSTFSGDALKLFQSGAFLPFLLYVFGSVLIGICFTLAGWRLVAP
ncbi:fluoride efflux transporter CrcB [Coprobacter tertius]|uniref:Fluoride-specific ion channel FluC n=1 Tax=Coprobacter tertius TaxID=2944915 RepID=A0ABT1MF09_9BACT|nr:fluoride efflux transporter CrcB [Coprobacter tertius]MCP9611215.1 fluoride efflux transporter CrcB [Coprobacter tertius]